MKKISSHNPFYFGGVVSGKHFCDRKSEITTIRRDLNNGLNLLIYAPRRFGKTSLIENTLQQIDAQTIFMDMMSVVDEREFINHYFNAISASLYTTTDKLISFFKKSLQIRPNISVNFDQSGQAKYSLSFDTSDQPAVFNEVVDIPNRCAIHQQKGVIVVFDEFQEIKRLGFVDKLRAVIQKHSANVAYLFSGSKKSIMTQLFFDRSNAFYRSVKHVPITAIDDHAWIEYIRSGFEQHNKQIDTEHITQILNISKGFPYYTQQIAYELFNITPGKCYNEHLLQAVSLILEREADLFLFEWENLSTNQKKALKLLIRSGGKNIYQKETMDMFGLTNSTLKKAVEGLMAKDVIDLDSGGYYLQDPLFAYFMKTRFYR